MEIVDKHRSGISGLVATPVAETGVLAVIGSAPVVVLAAAASSTSATTASSSSATTTTTAPSKAAATAASPRTAAGAAKSWTTAASGTSGETPIDAAGAKTAETEAIARDHAGRSSQSSAAQSADSSSSASAGRSAAGRSASHSLAAILIVAGLCQPAAGAAIHKKRLLGCVCAAKVRIGSSQRIRRSSSGLLAFGSGANLGVLESRAARTTWTALRSGRPASAATGLVAARLVTPRSGSRRAIAESAAAAAIRSRSGGSCGCGRFRSVAFFLAKARHLHRPILIAAGAHIDRFVDGGESENLHLDVPDAGRQVHRVAAILVGVGDDLLVALFGGYGGAWNELVRGAYGTAVGDSVDLRNEQ